MKPHPQVYWLVAIHPSVVSSFTTPPAKDGLRVDARRAMRGVVGNARIAV